MMKWWPLYALLLMPLLKPFEATTLINDVSIVLNEEHLTLTITTMTMAKAVVHVVERYIASRVNTLVIMERCSHCTTEQKQFHERLLHQLLHSLSRKLALHLYMGTTYDHPWDYQLFIVNSCQAFEELSFFLPDTLHEREFYILIVFTMSDKRISHHLREMFLACLRLKVLNVVIMTEFDSSTVAFTSYWIFNQNCNDKISFYTTNYFSRHGHLTVDALFPQRTLYLFNCPLNVSAHVVPPFFMYKGTPLPPEGALMDANQFHGIEGDLLKVLGSVLKFQIWLRIPMGASKIGSNLNSTGCFLQLEQGLADIALGGFSGSDYRRFKFSNTPVYHQSYFVFVVRTKHHFDGRIGHLIKPFRNKVWIALLLTLSSAFLTTQVLRFSSLLRLRHFLLGPENQSPVENIVATFFGNPIVNGRMPKTSFARFLLISWLMLTLVLRSAYQGKLFDVLRVSCRGPLPANLRDMLTQNYTLVHTHYAHYYPPERTLIVEADFQERFQLLELAPSSRLATVSLSYNLAHYNRQSRGLSQLTYVPEPIYLNPLVMYLRKHSILRLSLSHKIKQLMSAGIIAHIERQYVQTRFVEMNAHLLVVPKLSKNMFCGVYYCYLTLLGCAGIVLILELLSMDCRFLQVIFEVL